MRPASTAVLLDDIARTVRAVRTAVRWTQRDLAAQSGVAQPTISRIERGSMPGLSVAALDRLCVALGIRYSITWDPPRTIATPRDHVHAMCSAYVARRLAAAGWIVEREVEIGGDRSRGWIDGIAFHPARSVLLVTEIKTEIDDIGAVERQLNWYAREAGHVARARGWRPTTTTSALILLASRANDLILASSSDVFRLGFPGRARAFRALVDGHLTDMPRAVAMIDPRSRRVAWLLPTRLDGRRTPAPYRDYRDAAARRSAAGASR